MSQNGGWCFYFVIQTDRMIISNQQTVMMNNNKTMKPLSNEIGTMKQSNNVFF